MSRMKRSDRMDSLDNSPSNDLFIVARRRMTVFHTVLITLILTVFIIVAYVLLTFLTLNDQKVNLANLVRQEASSLEQTLIDGKQVQNIDMDNPRVRKSGNDVFFYYFVARDGTVIAGGEVFPSLRNEFLQLVNGWNPAHTEVQSTSLSIANEVTADTSNWRRLLPAFISSPDMQLMISAKSIQSRDGTAGTLYMGINATSRYTTLQWMLFILIGLVLIFVAIAFWIGSYMSKKAMVPVVESYTKQQQFLTDASHELRTPLSVLLSSINVLEMEAGANKDTYAFKTMVQMKDEVKRMSSMVSDLLLLARTDSSELTLTMRLLDFKPLAEQTIQSMELLASAKHITIRLNAPEQTLVYGDSDKLRQVLYILLDNAIKYSPEHTEVKVELAHTLTRKQSFILTVQDSGPGIQPSDAERVFDRFYRADKARSRQTSGHGLGLAIAKFIVTAHNGQISVSGRKDTGAGSIFRVTLPLDPVQSSKIQHGKTR